MHEFNDRANGIFADGYLDANGLPVRDTFAAQVRAALFGVAARDWTKSRLAAFIAAFCSDQLAQLAEEGRAAFQSGTRGPDHAGIYLLADGRFARYDAGMWSFEAETPVQVPPMTTRASMFSCQFRSALAYRWYGPTHLVKVAPCA